MQLVIYHTKQKCITFSQYEQIAKQINECLTLLLNWIKSDENRIKQNETI